jgi:hypothetical protein
MHVTWIVSGAIDRRADGRLISPIASVRYRVLYIAEHLATRGHRVDMIQAGLQVDTPQLESPLRADVVIMSKGLFEGSVAIANRAKQLGAHVLVDLCDDHFDTLFRETYLSLCSLAEGITASTPMMARVIAQRAGREATVIGDPFEAPYGEPRFQPAQRVRLLWFGHPSNFDTLAAMMPRLIEFTQERPVELHVVSENFANITAALAQVSHKHGPHLLTRFTPWSQDATWHALAECDAVLIPSLPTEAKLVKSPNRLVESIRCGRFVAAFPLPSYQPFSHGAWLGQDVTDGLRWALANPTEVLNRIRCGQRFVADNFSSDILARAWESEISRYAASRLASFAKPVVASMLPRSMTNAR